MGLPPLYLYVVVAVTLAFTFDVDAKDCKQPTDACKLIAKDKNVVPFCMPSKIIGPKCKGTVAGCGDPSCSCCVPHEDHCVTINYSFYYKHVCEMCRTPVTALRFIILARDPEDTVWDPINQVNVLIRGSTVFSNVLGDMKYEKAEYTNALGGSDLTCKIVKPVKTWWCDIHVNVVNNKREWNQCVEKNATNAVSSGGCTGQYAQKNGHLFPGSLVPLQQCR